MTSKEINREIYRTLHNRRNCISQWNQVETVRINKNSFSGKYQLSSKIQRTSKVKEAKLIEVEEVKEQKVEKILNKRKIREVVRYLVQ